MNLLLLGGTADARQLASALAVRPGIGATLSLAGVTARPAPMPIACRRGGFGGVAGLMSYLRAAAVTHVVDATHPFAARMSQHAATACARLDLPLWRLQRPPWSADSETGWHHVRDSEEAAARLSEFGPRVWLTVGARSLMPFETVADKHWLVRSIEAPSPAPAFADWTLVTARPPFSVADEIALIERHAIDVLVTKNSGAPALRPKLDAAAALGVPVLMIARPALPPAARGFDTPEALAAALDALT